MAALLVPWLAAACQSISAPAPVPDPATSTQPLTPVPGDPARGREVALSRDAGNCTLCHALPGVAMAGDVGPPLAGIGSRKTAAELRRQLIDPQQLNPDSVMPAYYRTEGLNRVAQAYAGRPILTAQQLEDIVAYLATLRD